jgi:hypothetical protein
LLLQRVVIEKIRNYLVAEEVAAEALGVAAARGVVDGRALALVEAGRIDAGGVARISSFNVSKSSNESLKGIERAFSVVGLVAAVRKIRYPPPTISSHPIKAIILIQSSFPLPSPAIFFDSRKRE